jgi:hypothetical protein
VSAHAFVALAGCLLAARPAAAQVGLPDSLLDRPAQLEVENVTLEDALLLLQRQSGVTIAFGPEFLPADRRVECDCRHLTVRQALERLLAGLPLEVRVTRTQVLLVPRLADTTTRAPDPTDPDPRRRRTVALSPVVVTGDSAADRARFRASAQTSAVTLSAAEVAAIPGTVEPDVLRAIQLTPGTVARNDYSIGYNVRGGENDQNLVLLDGFTVFNPSHLGGLFSTFDPSAVSSLNLVTGDIPVSYGSRLSSVLDVRLREGRRDGVHGGAHVSLLSSRLSLEGPLGPATFLLSARRTYADQVIRAFTPYEVPYYFTDVIGRASVPLGRKGTLAATVFWSRDALDYEVLDADTTSGRRDPIDLDFTWGNRVAGLAWRQAAGNGVITLRAGLSDFVSDLSLTPAIAAFDNVMRQWTGAMHYQVAAGAHRVSLGAGVDRYHARFRIDEPGFETFSEDPQNYGFIPLFNRTYAPLVLSAFVDDDWRVTDQVIVRPGVRIARVSGAEVTTLDPRLSFKAFLSRSSAVTVTAGRYHQEVQSLHDQDLPITIFEFWVAANARVPVARSDQISLGYERWLGDAWQVVVEAYRRTFEDLVIPNRAMALRDEGDEFQRMTGDAWGADVWIRRHAGAVRGWLGYGYAKATRRVGATEFPASHDRRHTLNVVVDAPGPLGANLGIRWTYGSPLPYSGFSGEWNHRAYSAGLGAFAIGEDEPISLAINDRRFPSYQRLDVGLRWRLGGPGLEWRPYLQVANAYNRRNVFWYTYDYDQAPTRKGISQVPILPTFGVEVSW